MTYEFFLKYNDISDYDIKEIYIKDNKLYLDLVMPIKLELIANGYRPELLMENEKTFIFSLKGNNEVFSTKEIISFEKDKIIIGNKEYPLLNKEIEIKKN